MLLALDIGNSAVKLGLFDGPARARVVTHDFEAVPPTDASAWHRALADSLNDVTIQRVAYVSVVPEAAEAVLAAVRRLTSAPVLRLGPSQPLPFTLDYDTPDTLGPDRLAAAAAGWVQFGRDTGRSVIVVDAGTAVTHEVVHRDGVYQGGAISAGSALTRSALRDGTAQLPEVPLDVPDGPVGTSTQSALQSGIMYGLIDSVQGMARRLATELPDNPALVVTGGWSRLLAARLDRPAHRVPHLVLDGVRLLADRAEG
jgi:type III pantothenate kinase